MATRILDPRVIHTRKEYQAVMAEVDRLLDLKPRRGSQEDQRLELLTLLAEDYETRTEPDVPPGKPQSIVEFMLEQKGLTRADLVKPLGGKSRVSEFFAGKRQLSTNQVKALRDLLGVPADLLLESGTGTSGEGVEVVSLQFHRRRPAAYFSGAAPRPKAIAAKRNPSASKAARKKKAT